MSDHNPSCRAEETVNFTLSRRSWLGQVGGGAALLLGFGPGLSSADAAEQPAFDATTNLGRFLVISDFHLDPFLGLTREQFSALAAAPIAEWPRLLGGQPAPKFGTDSPLALVQAALMTRRSVYPIPTSFSYRATSSPTAGRKSTIASPPFLTVRTRARTTNSPRG